MQPTQASLPRLPPAQWYKDDNYKPEMALALTEFEALCQFVGQAELAAAVEAVPELLECTGDALAEALIHGQPADAAQHLRGAFRALMVCDAEVVAGAISRMDARLRAEAASRPLSDKERLVLRLNEQYPGDVGVLAAWFLNYVRLRPGQAIYLEPNEPHAYVSGDIVECMATSDNVIRAGLTPKVRDTEVLCSSLTYSQGAPEVLEGDKVLPHLRCYRPPFREFEIACFSPPGGTTTTLPACHGPLIMLVQRGKASLQASWQQQSGRACSRPMQRGDVWFVGAGTSLEFVVEEDMVVWFAACNGMGFAPPAPTNNAVPFSLRGAAAAAVNS
jgi:mannose-6-phosphate isomerase